MTISRINSFSTAKLRRPTTATFLKPRAAVIVPAQSSSSSRSPQNSKMDSIPLTIMLRDLKLSHTVSSPTHGLSKSKFQYCGMVSRKKSFCLFSLDDTHDKIAMTRNLSPKSVIENDSMEETQDYGFFEDYEETVTSSFPSTEKFDFDF